MADSFEYKIVENNDVVVVTFQGKLSRDAKDGLKKCHQELIHISSKYIIFFFKDVSLVEPIILRDLTLIQHDTRKNNKRIFVTGLSPSLKQNLNGKGIIRLTEFKNSLDEALKSIL